MDDTTIPIIDTHQHLWDLKALKLAWVEGSPSLNRSFLPADYAKAAEGLGIERSVYLEVDVVPEQQALEAEAILGIIRRKEGVTAAARDLRPARAGGFSRLTRSDSPRTRRSKDCAGSSTVRRPRRGTSSPPSSSRGSNYSANWGSISSFCPAPGRTPGHDQARRCLPRDRIRPRPPGETRDLSDLTKWSKGHGRVWRSASGVWCKVSGIVASAREGWKAGRPGRRPSNHGLESLRPRPRDVRRRLARLHAPRDPQGVGRGPARDRCRAARGGKRRKLFRDNAVRCYRLG
jgi:L-fuconolactonase